MTIRKGQWEVQDFTPLVDLVERTDNALEALGLFEEFFGNTTTVEVERVTVGHDEIEDKARGGERNYADVDQAQAEFFRIPFFPMDGYVKANDVQDFRAYGEENAPATVDTRVERKMTRIQNSHDKLRRRAMYHALVSGETFAPSGATQYVKNYATTWGVTGDVVTDSIDFTVATADPALKIETVGREHIINQAQDDAGSYSIVCLCGSGFFNSIVNHPLVQAAYDQYSSEQEPLRRRLGANGNENAVGRIFSHKGVTYIEDVSNQIGRGDAYVMPVGIDSMWQIHYAPSDTIEDANQIAERMYVWMVEERRKAAIESETSFVVVNNRPELVVSFTGNTLLPDA